MGLGRSWQPDAESGCGESLPARARWLITAGVAIGTSAYMSPQQGVDQTVDDRSDVYDQRVMLYEMVVERKPYVVCIRPASCASASFSDPQSCTIARVLGRISVSITQSRRRSCSMRARCATAGVPIRFLTSWGSWSRLKSCRISQSGE